jgi:hypothetical protein
VPDGLAGFSPVEQPLRQNNRSKAAPAQCRIRFGPSVALGKAALFCCDGVAVAPGISKLSAIEDWMASWLPQVGPMPTLEGLWHS